MIDPDTKSRAEDLLRRLNLQNPIGVEVGVHRGQMAEALLQLCPNLLLYMVDSYLPVYYSSNREENYQEALSRTEFASTRCFFLLMNSLEAVKHVPQLDFAFIDADHDYVSVRSDIEAWKTVLKPGGLLGGHDYCAEEVGVMLAVDEAAKFHGWNIEFGTNTTWYVRL